MGKSLTAVCANAALYTATRTVTYGPRSVVARAPKLWNTLSTTFQHSTLTFIEFCRQLKLNCLV